MTFHGSMELLAHARANIDRVSPTQAFAEVERGDAILIDVRTDVHRAQQGVIPGAICIDLTVLPWRIDPTFEWKIPEATAFDQRYILVCRHGYSTSVAAWQLGLMGMTNVVDIEGGVEAWMAAGLPMSDGPADVRP